MKKRYIMFLFALLIKTVLHAQSELGQIELSIKSPLDVYPAVDSLGNLAYVFQGSKQYQVSFLNSDFKTNPAILINRDPTDRKDKIIGSLLDNGIVSVYLLNKKLRTVSVLVVDRNGSTGSYVKLITLKPNEEYLNGVSMNGKFYVLTVPKFKNELTIYTLVKGSSEETVAYNIEMPTFNAKLTANNNYLNTPAESTVGVEEMRYSPENNIKSSYPDKKFYYMNNKMYFTFDEPNSTHLVEIDPVYHKATYKKMNFSLDRGNNSRSKQGNSFMFDNRLFRGTISPDQMNLSILDLDSMRLINSYNFYPETDIVINNGPIVQEGGTSSIALDNERILKKPEQYFRKVLGGNFSVAANKIDSGKYEVELGAYEEIVTTRGGNYGGYGAPISIGIGMGGGIGIGGGGFGYPMSYGYGGFPGSYYGGFPGYYSGGSTSSTRIRVTYFKTLLHNEDFKHLEGQVPKTLRESINDYEQDNFRNSSPENIRLTAFSDKLLLGYYLKSRKKYTIVQFRKS